MKKHEDTAAACREFTRFLEIIDTLRNPGGCPWDIEQTPESLRGNLVEEAYETVEALNAGDPEHVREELGDVMLLVGMISRIFSESGSFNIADVLREVSDKLIRRHPHVFGSVEVENTEEVLRNWEQIKIDVEGRAEKSALDNIPANYPPLQKAWKMQKKAAKKGFDWPDSSGAQNKILEELKELEEAAPECREEELGDLLFSVVNLARHLHINPVLALQQANSKFNKRFRYVEQKMAENNIPMSPDKLEQMDKFWDESK